MTERRLFIGVLTAVICAAGGFVFGLLFFGPWLDWFLPRALTMPCPHLTSFGFWFFASMWGISGAVRGFGIGIKP